MWVSGFYLRVMEPAKPQTAPKKGTFTHTRSDATVTSSRPTDEGGKAVDRCGDRAPYSALLPWSTVIRALIPSFESTGHCSCSAVLVYGDRGAWPFHGVIVVEIPLTPVVRVASVL